LKPKREDKSGEYLKRIDALTNIMIAQSAKSTPKRKAPVKKLTPEKRKELEAYKKKNELDQKVQVVQVVLVKVTSLLHFVNK